MSKRNDKNSAKMSLSLSRSAAQLYCIMMKTLCLHGKLYEFLFLHLTRIFIYSGSGIDFPKVLRRISYDLSLATSSLAVGCLAAKDGSLRSPRGRLVASLVLAVLQYFYIIRTTLEFKACNVYYVLCILQGQFCTYFRMELVVFYCSVLYSAF